MSKYTDYEEAVKFKEPILAQKGVSAVIESAEKGTWKSKVDGKEYDTCKLTIILTDDSIKTEHGDSIPKTTITDQFNIEPYPHFDKKSGDKSMLRPGRLFELEEAFGFEPVYVDGSGNSVEPFITRTGRKVAPKVEGVKRKINPSFFNAYFDANGNPNQANFSRKKVKVDVGVEKSEQFGDKNTIKAYKKAE